MADSQEHATAAGANAMAALLGLDMAPPRRLSNAGLHGLGTGRRGSNDVATSPERRNSNALAEPRHESGDFRTPSSELLRRSSSGGGGADRRGSGVDQRPRRDSSVSPAPPGRAEPAAAIPAPASGPLQPIRPSSIPLARHGDSGEDPSNDRRRLRRSESGQAPSRTRLASSGSWRAEEGPAAVPEAPPGASQAVVVQPLSSGAASSGDSSGSPRGLAAAVRPSRTARVAPLPLGRAREDTRDGGGGAKTGRSVSSSTGRMRMPTPTGDRATPDTGTPGGPGPRAARRIPTNSQLPLTFRMLSPGDSDGEDTDEEAAAAAAAAGPRQSRNNASQSDAGSQSGVGEKRSSSGAARRVRRGLRTCSAPFRALWSKYLDINVRKKQIIALILCEFISVSVLISIHVGLLVAASRNDLEAMASSEVITAELVYGQKLAELSAAFSGLAENVNVLRAIEAYYAGGGEGQALLEAASKARAALQTEAIRSKIEYATLVAERDHQVIAGANKNRVGERKFDLGGLVERAMRTNTQVRGTVLVGRAEVEIQEGIIHLQSAPDGQYLVRVVVTPVYLVGTVDTNGRPSAVLVAGDIVNGKSAVVWPTMMAFKAGYVAVYQQGRDSGRGLLSCSLFTPAPQRSVTDNLDFGNPKGYDLLADALADPNAVPTIRFDVNGHTMTVAAKVIKDESSGRPVGFLVRGTTHAKANEVLRDTLVISLSVVAPILLINWTLALWMGKAISDPLASLHHTVERFFSEDVEGGGGGGGGAGAAQNAQNGGASAPPTANNNNKRHPSLRATIRQKDEVGKLARAFLQMGKRVSQAYLRVEEARLKANAEEHRTRQIMDTANDAIFLIDARCTVVTLNRRAESMFQYPAGELVGRNINQIMPEDTAEVHDIYVQRYLKTGQGRIIGNIRTEYALRKDGFVFPIELSISEMVIAGNTFFVGMIRDITQRREMEEELERERHRTEALLANMLPAGVAQRLKEMQDAALGEALKGERDPWGSGLPAPPSAPPVIAASMLSGRGGSRGAVKGALADRVENVSVMFADIVNFTPLAGSMDAADLVGMLNNIFSEFDSLAEKYGLEKIKTLGDAFMCAGGVPPEKSDNLRGTYHVERMAMMALEMHEVITKYKTFDGRPFRIRIGMHLGTVIAGVIGKKKFLYDLWGDTVNIASRMESSGLPGASQVSAEVYAMLRYKFAFEDRGRIHVKGKGDMHTYFLLRPLQAPKPTAGPASASVIGGGGGGGGGGAREPAALALAVGAPLSKSKLPPLVVSGAGGGPASSSPPAGAPGQDGMASLVPSAPLPPLLRLQHDPFAAASAAAAAAPAANESSPGPEQKEAEWEDTARNRSWGRHHIGRGALTQAALSLLLPARPEELEDDAYPLYTVPHGAYCNLFHWMLGRLGLVEACRIKEKHLRTFAAAALSGYRAGNAFHNAAHALDVAQMLFAMTCSMERERVTLAPPVPMEITGGDVATSAAASSGGGGVGIRARSGRMPPLDHVDLFAILVAALCHDLDHPGLTNLFLIKSKAPMALLYSNSSPLERHHSSRFLMLLERPDLDICSGLSPAERQRFTQFVVDIILATDMMAHGDYMAAFARRFRDLPPEALARLPSSGQRLAALDDRTLFAGMLLKCADLANAARTFENSQHWAGAIQHEFFEQGALEQQLGLEISPGMSPTTEPDLGSSARQVFFLGNIVQPLYQAVAEVAPDIMRRPLANVKNNLECWRRAHASLSAP